MPELFHTAAYIRLSREDGDREESDSVSNQRKLLTQFILNHEELLLYNIYIDDGYSGVHFHRPAFQKMLQDIKKSKINCVIVKDLSRFGRDYIEAGRYLERYFPEAGIRFISVMDHIDSLKQSYDILLPIKNIFNEQYARDISDKVHAAIKAKQINGDFIGAFASYGYQKSPSDKNKLIIDEYAADVVRRIFSLYLKGCGKSQIAHLLNEEGILCPSEYKKALGLRYQNPGRTETSALWSYSTINHILHKELYAGNMVQGLKKQRLRGQQHIQKKNQWIIVPDTHPPIIDKKTWEATCQLLKTKSRPASNMATRTAIEAETGTSETALLPAKHPFTGLLFCGDCQKAMVKTSWRHADGRLEYAFCCSTCKRHGRRFCTPHRLPAKIITAIVFHDLHLFLKRIDIKQYFSVCQIPDLSSQKTITEKDLHRTDFSPLPTFTAVPASSDSQLAMLKRNLNRLREEKQSAYQDYQTGLLSRQEFQFCQKKYRKKENLLSSQIQSIELKQKNLTAAVLNNQWSRTLLEKKRFEYLDNADLSALIHRITVYENHRIIIQYNFSGESLASLPDIFSAD